MLVLGLTGSIGMGKSTTAQIFRDEGVPVHDADAEVHRLYAGAAVEPVEAAFPGVTRNGSIDRDRLRALVIADPPALKRLESIVHPMVRAARDQFSAIVGKQMPDSEKRRRADWVVDTGQGLEIARRQARAIVDEARVLAADA